MSAASPDTIPVHHEHTEARTRPKITYAVELEPYAGKGTSLEAFLAKFEAHAKYYEWVEEDRLFHLKNSLTGIVATILWTGGRQSTTLELVQLLKARFGNENQSWRFWSELHARRRQPGERLQTLYLDIRRLIALACPSNEQSHTVERLAIRNFTTAFRNENMRFEVLDENPAKLEMALHIALRYEARERTLTEDNNLRQQHSALTQQPRL